MVEEDGEAVGEDADEEKWRWKMREPERDRARAAVMVEERRTPAPAIPASEGVEGGMVVQFGVPNIILDMVGLGCLVERGLFVVVNDVGIGDVERSSKR